MSKKTFCIRSLSQWVKHVFHLFFLGGRTVAISQSIVFFTEQDLLKSDWLCWHNMPPQQIVILGGLIYSSISLMYQRSLFVFFFSKSGFRNSCFNEKVIRTNSSWTLAHWLLILDCLFIVVKKTNPTGWQRKITWAMGNHINFLRAYNSQPDWPGARYKERSLDIQ